MIVADTNVLSEPLRRQPSPLVVEWLARNATELAVTTITIAELRFGVRRLPVGRRRQSLDAGISEMVTRAGQRILGFNIAAAERYAELRADREAAGISISVEDTMIAAICYVSDCAIATRNIDDFRGSGLTIINPFENA
jgi:predicted nucleic acid-binding protein